jgi:enamine deaminase RidA (YjgF/YER057c/UK114 family)
VKRLDQNFRRSRAIVVNGMVHLAGQVADDWKADIKVQTRQTLAKIDQLLTEAGTDRSKLVSVTIWLRTMDDYDGFNEVWDAWVIPEQTPTRACAEVRMARDDIKVELIAIASL